MSARIRSNAPSLNAEALSEARNAAPIESSCAVASVPPRANVVGFAPRLKPERAAPRDLSAGGASPGSTVRLFALQERRQWADVDGPAFVELMKDNEDFATTLWEEGAMASFSEHVYLRSAVKEADGSFILDVVVSSPSGASAPRVMSVRCDVSGTPDEPGYSLQPMMVPAEVSAEPSATDAPPVSVAPTFDPEQQLDLDNVRAQLSLAQRETRAILSDLRRMSNDTAFSSAKVEAWLDNIATNLVNGDAPSGGQALGVDATTGRYVDAMTARALMGDGAVIPCAALVSALERADLALAGADEAQQFIGAGMTAGKLHATLRQALGR